MRKIGVLLALLVLFSALSVGTGMVSAFEDNTQNVGYTSAYIELTAKTTTGDVNATDITQNATAWVESLSSTIKVVYWVKDGVVHVKATFKSDPGTNARLLRLLAPAKMIQGQTKTALETILLNLGVPYDSASVSYDSNIISGDVRVYAVVSYGTNVHVTFKAEEGFLKAINYHDSVDHKNNVYIDGSSIGKPDWYLLQDNGSQRTIDLYAHDDYGNACKIGLIFVGSDEGFSPASNFPESSYEVASYTLNVGLKNVAFHITNALTNQPLTGVTVKEGDTVLGTVDDGGTLELAKGQHTLTFEKSGYWSETVTVDVQQDMSISVQLYPDTAAFRISAPASITTFENTITEVTFTISPIKQDAAYNTYMSISGLSDIIEVKEGSNTLSPQGGKYYLGDISGDTQITVKFRASTQGTKAFTLTLTSQDALGSTTYTTTKQVQYEVQPLPFQVQLPSTWTIGENTVRINEASGQQVLITLSLLDANGSEVWTDSYSFSPYEGHSFTVNIPAEGTYTLKAQWAGYTATWQVSVNPTISLVTDTVHVKKGEIGTVQVHIKNPTSNTQYYTIELTGGFIEGNVTKQVAVAPLSEKTVEIAFSVPEQLDFDAYDLTLKVLQGSAVQYQGTVHVIIDADSGLGLALPAGGNSTWLYVGAAGAALVLVGLAVSRRR